MSAQSGELPVGSCVNYWQALNPYAAGDEFGQYKMMQKNNWKMTDTLAHGYSSESTQQEYKWIPIWQGLDGFQKHLHHCALDESGLSIDRVEV